MAALKRFAIEVRCDNCLYLSPKKYFFTEIQDHPFNFFFILT